MADIRRDMLLVEEQAQLLDLAAKLRSVMPSEPLRVGVQTLAREMRDAILRLGVNSDRNPDLGRNPRRS